MSPTSAALRWPCATPCTNWSRSCVVGDRLRVPLTRRRRTPSRPLRSRRRRRVIRSRLVTCHLSLRRWGRPPPASVRASTLWSPRLRRSTRLRRPSGTPSAVPSRRPKVRRTARRPRVFKVRVWLWLLLPRPKYSPHNPRQTTGPWHLLSRRAQRGPSAPTRATRRKRQATSCPRPGSLRRGRSCAG